MFGTELDFESLYSRPDSSLWGCTALERMPRSFVFNLNIVWKIIQDFWLNGFGPAAQFTLVIILFFDIIIVDFTLGASKQNKNGPMSITHPKCRASERSEWNIICWESVDAYLAFACQHIYSWRLNPRTPSCFLLCPLKCSLFSAVSLMPSSWMALKPELLNS